MNAQPTTLCPTCRTINRANAQFCIKCGKSFTSLPTGLNPRPAAPTAAAPASFAPVAAQPIPSTAPQTTPQSAAKSASPDSFGKRVARGFGRVAYFVGLGLTLGGRAAYADLFDSKEHTRGQVLTLERKLVPARVEPGFILWLLAWVGFSLLLFLPPVWSMASFLLLLLVLIALALPGWRFLGFSRASAETLYHLARRFKRGTQLQTLFVAQTTNGHQTIVLRGTLQGTMQQQVNGKSKIVPYSGADKTLAVNHLVRVWGMSEGNILRAWKLEFLEVNGTPAQVWLSAPRVMPLTAALFIPLGFWFTVRILLLLIWQI